MSTQYQTRVANIENMLLLDKLCIDEHALREECKYEITYSHGQLTHSINSSTFSSPIINSPPGIPDKFRPLIWRLFLSFIPVQRHKWAETLREQRAHYATLVDQFLVGPSGGEMAENHANMEGIEPNSDHPLAITDESGWTSWFRDNDMVRQINNDVKRLRPEIDFFQRHTAYPMKTRIRLSERLSNDFLRPADSHSIDKLADKSFISCSSTMDDSEVQGRADGELHWEVVERMLFLFAKTNRGIGYVQGLNEIICPLYFVFATDPDDEWARHAEADSFYCFQNLISEIKDLFIRRMDSECCGIEAVLNSFYKRFQAHDPELFSHLVQRQQMKPQYFAFRWISLLLSQEFCLPDVIALWDSVFALPPGARLDQAQALCLAVLDELRPALLSSTDFGHNLRILQNFSSEAPGEEDLNINVPRLIARSLQMTAPGSTSNNGTHEQSFASENGKKDDKNNNNNNGNGHGASAFGSPALAEMRTRLRSLMDSAANSKLLASVRRGGGGGSVE